MEIENFTALWVEVLKEKYGVAIEDLLDAEVDTWPRYVSKWWKDIVTLDKGGGSWFNTGSDKEGEKWAYYFFLEYWVEGRNDI